MKWILGVLVLLALQSVASAAPIFYLSTSGGVHAFYTVPNPSYNSGTGYYYQFANATYNVVNVVYNELGSNTLPYSMVSTVSGYPSYSSGLVLLPSTSYAETNGTVGQPPSSGPVGFNVTFSASSVVGPGGTVGVGYGSAYTPNAIGAGFSTPPASISPPNGVWVILQSGTLAVYENGNLLVTYAVGTGYTAATAFAMGLYLSGNTLTVYWYNGTWMVRNVGLPTSVSVAANVYQVAVGDHGPGYGYATWTVDGVSARENLVIDVYSLESGNYMALYSFAMNEVWFSYYVPGAAGYATSMTAVQVYNTSGPVIGQFLISGAWNLTVVGAPPSPSPLYLRFTVSTPYGQGVVWAAAVIIGYPFSLNGPIQPYTVFLSGSVLNAQYTAEEFSLSFVVSTAMRAYVAGVGTPYVQANAVMVGNTLYSATNATVSGTNPLFTQLNVQFTLPAVQAPSNVMLTATGGVLYSNQYYPLFRSTITVADYPLTTSPRITYSYTVGARNMSLQFTFLSTTPNFTVSFPSALAEAVIPTVPSNYSLFIEVSAPTTLQLSYNGLHPASFALLNTPAIVNVINGYAWVVTGTSSQNPQIVGTVNNITLVNVPAGTTVTVYGEANAQYGQGVPSQAWTVSISNGSAFTQVASGYTSANGQASVVVPVILWTTTQYINVYWAGVTHVTFPVNVPFLTPSSTYTSISTPPSATYNYTSPLRNTLPPNSVLYTWPQPWATLTGVVVVAVIAVLGFKFAGVPGLGALLTLGVAVAAYVGVFPWWAWYVLVLAIALLTAKAVVDRMVGE